MAVSLLDGTSFMVSDDLGDCNGIETEGFFFQDTRFLSVYRVRLNSEPLMRLSADTRSYYGARFFLSSPATVFLNPELSLSRERALGRGVREDIRVSNHRGEAVQIVVEIELDADFRDLFEVKEKLPPLGTVRCARDAKRVLFSYQYASFRRQTLIELSQMPHFVPGKPARALFRATIAPKSEWQLCVIIVPVTEQGEQRPKYGRGDLERPRPEMQESYEQWLELAPKLDTDWDALSHTYTRSVVDLAALRFYPGPGEGAVPAAGLPWFMALFGRDTLITSLQTLPFFPELAECTLNCLARRQAQRDDPFRDAEPGKILHEERLGELTITGRRPHSPYYGTVDATPLFLVLLEEYERWTGDAGLVRRLEPNARAALEWLERRQPFVSYRKRSEQGLDNQCWKDSWNSMQFHDGTLAQPPIATIEAQAYAIAAYRAVARLAQRVWKDPALAEHARTGASELQAAVESQFWLPQAGHYALALDGQGRAVDALTSNIGHLPWSAACDRQRAGAVCARLMDDRLFSGWGVRTMATSEAGYNPLGYHNGTVWPHDNSLIAAGLARYGLRPEANRIAAAMIEAASEFRYRLPEVFAGYGRKETGFPVEYPTASSPQAWAAGAPLLLLGAMLGLEATAEGTLKADPVLPDEASFIALTGIRHRGARYALRAEHKGAVLERL